VFLTFFKFLFEHFLRLWFKDVRDFLCVNADSGRYADAPVCWTGLIWLCCHRRVSLTQWTVQRGQLSQTFRRVLRHSEQEHRSTDACPYTARRWWLSWVLFLPSTATFPDSVTPCHVLICRLSVYFIFYRVTFSWCTQLGLFHLITRPVSMLYSLSCPTVIPSLTVWENDRITRHYWTKAHILITMTF